MRVLLIYLCPKDLVLMSQNYTKYIVIIYNDRYKCAQQIVYRILPRFFFFFFFFFFFYMKLFTYS